ncbi:MAG: diguanylate cyclase [Myxococcota bacterium]
MSPSEPVQAEAIRASASPEDQLRRGIVLLTSGLGGVLCLIFSFLESTKLNFDAVERYGLPAVGVLFLVMAVLGWRGHTRWTEWSIVICGSALLLERTRHVVNEPNPDLARVVNAYEMLAWFPCLYLFTFLLFEKKQALVFSLVMVAASALIVGGGELGGVSNELYRIDAHEFYASHLFCILFIYMLSRLKERYVATQREASALRTYAETDFLTGVANRRSLSESLEREIHRSARTGRSLAVILLDVDRFKDVNDTLGHDEGDRALRRIALVMDRNRRRSDLFGRWGGEEFLLVAPELDLEGGRAAAERLRAIIEQSSRGSRASITASFGVAEYTAGDDVASLVRRADEALIAAKTGGRNRVEAKAA